MTAVLMWAVARHHHSHGVWLLLLLLAGALQGRQEGTSVPVSCAVPSTPGSHNLTLTATYMQDSTCGGSSGTATAQAHVLVHPRPAVSLAPVAASVPVCSGSGSVTGEFAYTTTPNADEALQLEPRVSVAGASLACTVIQQGEGCWLPCSAASACAALAAEKPS